ncbi:VOC family protein [Desulfococcus sp.]|uniref:VOC family protein n=1 Tax=Desulfococcus sp. TaxID=2025834 RepID=UPI0035937251
MTGNRVGRMNTILYCRSWEAAVGFYRDVLGLPIRLETDWFVEFGVDGGAFLSLADEGRAAVKSAGGGGITLSFQVADAALWHRRLERRGIAVDPIRRRWGARAFFFRDPEGHRIEIWQPEPLTPGHGQPIP